MEVSEIRELAKRFTPEQIEGCISQQVETGANVCLTGPAAEEIINELSKAEFVRELVDGGMRLPDALRELAKRMRQFQEGGPQ